MFQKFQPAHIINEISLVPYRDMRLNANNNKLCLKVFQKEIPDNAIIVYSSFNDSVVILGYYVIDNLNIIQSRFYESLRSATIAFEGCDLTKEIESIPCIHISEWCFDESLREQRYLQYIFSDIISNNDENRSIVWCDNCNEVFFYPIVRNENILSNTAAIIYFTDNFIQK